jgi:hypothetical protein
VRVKDTDDRRDQVCTKCGAGHYTETSIHDDWDGVLHCNNKECNHEVKRYKSEDEPKPESMENTALSPEAQAVLDAFLSEWPDEALEQDRKCLAAALRAVVKELKCFGITEKNILAIADELETL